MDIMLTPIGSSLAAALARPLQVKVMLRLAGSFVSIIGFCTNSPGELRVPMMYEISSVSPGLMLRAACPLTRSPHFGFSLMFSTPSPPFFTLNVKVTSLPRHTGSACTSGCSQTQRGCGWSGGGGVRLISGGGVWQLLCVVDWLVGCVVAAVGAAPGVGVVVSAAVPVPGVGLGEGAAGLTNLGRAPGAAGAGADVGAGAGTLGAFLNFSSISRRSSSFVILAGSAGCAAAPVGCVAAAG
jgi:hypothetical protein